MSNDSHWKRLARNTVHDTRFMKMHLDKVQLPSSEVVDDYEVVALPDAVIVAATDQDDNLILFREYKYAVDKTVLTFSAGGVGKDESPTDAATRELLEETGYGKGEVEYIAPLMVYPSKVEHTSHIVRITHAKKITDVEHENTETISEVELVPLDQIPRLIEEGWLNTMHMVAAMALAFPGYLKR